MGPQGRQVPVAVIVDYIDDHRDRLVEGRELGGEPICRVLAQAGVQIAPSTYYAAKTRAPSARAVRDARLISVIHTVHEQNLGVYGARKIDAELNRRRADGDDHVARCTVERLMRAEGLQGIRRAKGPRTTVGAPTRKHPGRRTWSNGTAQPKPRTLCGWRL